jgi:plastocyanin
MRGALLAALAALALAPGGALAQGHDHGGEPGRAEISIGYAAFDPPLTDVLRGDAVRWDNASVRRHDVAAVDGSFDSGVLVAGAGFAHTFKAPGDVAYYCTIHPFMRGTVAVHDLMLDTPSEPAVTGRTFPLRGRTALAPGTPISIEADEGAGFVPVASTSAGKDGTFAADVRPHGSEQLRAVAGSAASAPVQLLVLDRKVTATARSRSRRSVVRVHVTPAGHGGMVVLQLRLRERFGWWTTARAKLDHHGRARFSLRTPRRVRARVVLTLADGATPLAISAPLRLGRG